MKREEQFIDVDWNMLNEYLPEKLVEEMDAERNTVIHRKLSAVPSYTAASPLQTSRSKATTTDIELLANPTIYEIGEIANVSISCPQDASADHFALPIIDFRETDNVESQNIRKELTTRFLTALSVDYERQWYLGMIRRRTLHSKKKSCSPEPLKKVR